MEDQAPSKATIETLIRAAATAPQWIRVSFFFTNLSAPSCRLSAVTRAHPIPYPSPPTTPHPPPIFRLPDTQGKFSFYCPLGFVTRVHHSLPNFVGVWSCCMSIDAESSTVSVTWCFAWRWSLKHPLYNSKTPVCLCRHMVGVDGSCYHGTNTTRVSIHGTSRHRPLAYFSRSQGRPVTLLLPLKGSA